MAGLLTDKTRTWREKFWWAIHNIIAHPLNELLYWFGFESAGNYVHDLTVPKHRKKTERK